ncbi:pentatricopeptide repeat-containing protein At2g13600-like [Aristolochia californica]|uniref:pentatricopeptide repeat-containing protein At2g13600-like n=1 Tax=Aristolochia californica TaxID=171875 RepID=UPI0035E2CBCC
MKILSRLVNSVEKQRCGFSTLNQYIQCGTGEERKITPYSAVGSLFILKRSLTQTVSNNGGLHGVEVVYGKMLDRNVFSWTSVISEFGKNEFPDYSLSCFLQMIRVGIEPNEFTFSTVVGICSRWRMMDFGLSLHCLLVKVGFSCQGFVASGLITMYAKRCCIKEAQQVFYEMPIKDAVSFNSMLTAYAQNGFTTEAVHMFSLMFTNRSHHASLVSSFTVATVFKACATFGCIRTCKCVHSCVVKLDLDLDIVAAASMVDMYSKCGSLIRARQVFDQMGERDLVTWNAMISGYSQNSCAKEAFVLFFQMRTEGIVPNDTTFTSTLRALSEMGDVTLGRYLHVKVIKFGCDCDVFTGTALVDMYSKCSCIKEAERAFEEMPQKNLIAFNAIISGHCINGKYRKALKVYMILLQGSMIPDSITFSALISSCSLDRALFEGTEIHAQSMKLGLDLHVSVANSLVSLYSKCHLTDRASKVFESIFLPTVISWTGIITGFAQNGEGEEALKYFCKMHWLHQKPDEFSVASVLKAIANWATVEQGRNVHSYAIKVGLELDIVVGTALVDMYSKCGVPEDSFKIFTIMPQKNIVSWNSMIVGFAQNGLSGKSLQLFSDMVKTGMNPCCVTFIGVLYACNHACLVEEGRNYFDLMNSIYGMSPSAEHYTCLVDLLGRAGHLHEAEMLIMNSPFSSDAMIWRSLLAACAFHKDMHVGVRAAENCLKLEPQASATYVILSNLYASKYLWNEVSMVRNLMRGHGSEKKLGCSWIVLRNKVYSFLAKNESHLHTNETAITLGRLLEHMQSDDNIAV